MSPNCGICGHKFVAGVTVVREAIPAEGESLGYDRVVHASCGGYSPERVEEMLSNGNAAVVPGEAAE